MVRGRQAQHLQGIDLLVGLHGGQLGGKGRIGGGVGRIDDAERGHAALHQRQGARLVVSGRRDEAVIATKFGTIRHTEGDEFVPQLSVSIGVVFALASLWVFIYFIHHVSVMIQSSEVVGRVGRELNACIDRFGNAPRSPQPKKTASGSSACASSTTSP